MLEPKSSYVRKKMRGLKFTEKNREYVHTLLKLEKWVLECPKRFSDIWGNHIGGWMEYDENDYIEILKELNPEKYKKYLKAKKEIEKECKDDEKSWKERERKELEQDKLIWKKFGGKL